MTCLGWVKFGQRIAGLLKKNYQQKDTGWGCCVEMCRMSHNIIQWYPTSSRLPRRPPSSANAPPNLRARLAHGLKPSWPTSELKSWGKYCWIEKSDATTRNLGWSTRINQNQPTYSTQPINLWVEISSPEIWACLLSCSPPDKNKLQRFVKGSSGHGPKPWYLGGPQSVQPQAWYPSPADHLRVSRCTTHGIDDLLEASHSLFQSLEF